MCYSRDEIESIASSENADDDWDERGDIDVSGTFYDNEDT